MFKFISVGLFLQLFRRTIHSYKDSIVVKKLSLEKEINLMHRFEEILNTPSNIRKYRG